ncbi:hypothetical protein FHT00_000592 [Sphingomonas insulae]|uniref:Carboxypeptidase regulatory-like domain-containing protein n=1 Tax=Sphingomonas insulae TaxID=424800 RepID=A0ABN1HWG7_9SPHN|nr:carboxypeptidase regulatory-like domain-containing protein [Sphingomonas insulae]NIJ28664.1 hypothetical protein [Sphingomonas insulae]
MTPDRLVAMLLVIAVVAAWCRLWLWQRGAPVRSPSWRVAALAALQPVLAGALYLTLFAPSRQITADTLVIATEGAPRLIQTGTGETIVALPEAGAIPGAQREPDLATALRRHTAAAAIRIVGSGLVARDRPAAARMTVTYAAPSVPRGLVALTPPGPVAPGARFDVLARIEGGGSATLVDPAGRVVDTARPDADGNVVLHGVARVAGIALFGLRLTGGDTAAVPVVTVAAAPARAVILAGAPGPEVKFLRRWAADAGLTSQEQLAVGGGLALGEAPTTFAGYDLAVLDDRSWTALGGGARAALVQAVRGGMGLIVRLTGPVPHNWQVAGLATGGGASIVPLRLAPAAPSQAALDARRGPGSRDAPASLAAPLDEVPELSRVATTIGGIPLLRDARGTPFAAWRNVGRGRVAIVSLVDSFALVTSGNGDAYADLWSTLATTIGRAGSSGAGPGSETLAWAGQRTIVCDIPAAGATAVAPDGATTALLADPAARGCAGYWPRLPGWHRIAGGLRYIHAAGALPQVRAAERRDATLALVGDRAASIAGARGDDHAPSWRWFLLFLAAVGLTWWLERRRR